MKVPLVSVPFGTSGNEGMVRGSYVPGCFYNHFLVGGRSGIRAADVASTEVLVGVGTWCVTT